MMENVSMDRADFVREVEKIADALKWADEHFDAEARMNAAKHMNIRVLPNPLAATIATARHSAERLLAIWRDGTPPDLLEDK